MKFFIDTQDLRNKIVYEKMLENNIDAKIFDENSLKSLKNTDKNTCFVFSPAKKWAKEELSSFPENITLICGKVAEEFLPILLQKQITYKNILSNEKFAIKNSKLTVQGVFGVILNNTKTFLPDTKILILGGGRLCIDLCVCFLKLGLDFSIQSFSKTKLDNLSHFSNNLYFEYDFLKDIQNFDIIINTRPEKFLEKEQLKEIRKDAIFIETASKNCLNPNEAHFLYLPSPALPQKFCAVSAGKVFYEAILGEFDI